MLLPSLFSVSLFTNLRVKSKNSATYLETNSWMINIGGFNIAIDPCLYSPLDFGIPFLYQGKKKFIDGKAELKKISSISDYVLITQGLDDHAHLPTLKELSKTNPNMKYIAPNSALPVLKSCGIKENNVQILKPNDSLRLQKGAEQIDILCTNGALVGPPWQANENGYIIKSIGKKNSVSVYYEPHCMYDEAELSKYQVDYVITPITAQQLPYFTLVAGGEKALNLAKILKAKAILPMANGNLEQNGLLSSIIKSEGSEDDFINLLKSSKLNIKYINVKPGEEIELS